VCIILYCLNCRPDCAYAVSEAATHNSNPTNFDYYVLKKAGQYLYNTQELGLTLLASKTITLTCWVDARFLSHLSSWKSHTGCCVSPGVHGMFYSKSSVQLLVARSSIHAEIRSHYALLQKVLYFWLNYLRNSAL
jgi:hypothetical protein